MARDDRPEVDEGERAPRDGKDGRAGDGVGSEADGVPLVPGFQCGVVLVVVFRRSRGVGAGSSSRGHAPRERGWCAKI